MVKKLIVLLFFISSVCLADDDSKHILYSIEKNGKTSHILGTVHTVTSEAEDVHPLLPDLISQSRVALFEIINREDRFEEVDAFLESFYNRNNTFESSLGLSAEAKARLKHFVSEISLEHSHLKYWSLLSPGILLLSLKEALFSLNKELNEDRTYTTFDSRLREKFKGSETLLVSLDSEQRYLKAFYNFVTVDGLSQYIVTRLPKITFNAVLKKAKNVSTTSAILGALEKSIRKSEAEDRHEKTYLKEDVKNILTKEFKEETESSAFERATLYGRNQIWAPKILEELEKGEAFVIVGLAHLHLQSEWGQSLLEIFEDNGYTLKSLPKADYKNVGSNSFSCLKMLTGR